MAFAKGQQSTEGAARTLYQGVGAVRVVAVNPTKAELEKFYGRELDKEPEYVTEVDIEGTKYPSVRISFLVQTDPEKNNGIETSTMHTFFLQKRYNQGKQSGKYQIIDKYGRTAWATKDEIKAKQIPQYSNGPASIDADYRPTYMGEEALTLFIKNYLNIPNVQVYVNGSWVDNPRATKEECEARLDSLDAYFKGNFKELKDILTLQPMNLVKIAFGIRTADDGRMYQTTYDRLCFKNGVTEYAKLLTEINERKSAGGLTNVEYDDTPLHEYNVTPTDLSAPAASTQGGGADLEGDPWE